MGFFWFIVSQIPLLLFTLLFADRQRKARLKVQAYKDYTESFILTEFEEKMPVPPSDEWLETAVDVVPWEFVDFIETLDVE